MTYKWIIVVLAACLLGACATRLEKGVSAYNAGKYDEAAGNWNTAATAGDLNAQYNLGLLWSAGLGSTPQNPAQAMAWFHKAATRGHVLSMVALAKHQLEAQQPNLALSWLSLAARWGDPAAISLLASMGAPVPGADLLAAHQVAQQQLQMAQQQAQAQLGYALGCAIAGGCAQASGPPVAVERSSAWTRTYTLREQWWDAGKRMCRYANSTVLNVKSNPCPQSVSAE